MKPYNWKLKFCLWKAYLDKGLWLTNYVKYLIAFFGLASRDVMTTLIIGIIYGFASFLIGYFWFYFRFIDAETEVGNLFNPFVRQMRKKIGVPNK